jgi:hypothetical protein
MKLKPFALILVLLALFAVSDRALTSAEATPAHSAVATASSSFLSGAVATSFVPSCPDICCDGTVCGCVRHGHLTTRGCVYDPGCICS